MKRTMLLTLFTLAVNLLFSQPFTEQTGISLEGVSGGSVAWGDYDNDGHLDILLTGDYVSKIYKNNDNNTFTEQIGIPLTGVVNGSAAWGDYDNDGDLDILLTGKINTDYISKIYKNNGNNTFTEQTRISLTPVAYSSVAWGDYDNDGDLDILLTGKESYEKPISKIYKNNGDNSFSEQRGISLIGISDGSASWGDYDNDSDLDILISGDAGETNITRIYKNNGNDSFSLQNGNSFTGVSWSSAAWGDYDNDGDLDILLAGYETYKTYLSKIYKNNGDNTFTKQNGISFTGVYKSSVAWGDYDNDGDLDVLLTGFTDSKDISKIYKNNSDNTFTEQTGISLNGVEDGSVAWGDYDNDGDLDILLAGYTGSNYITKVYKNECSITNTSPSAPICSTPIVKRNYVTLSWGKATDSQTPDDGLTYNLYIKKLPEDSLIISPMSDISSGFRKISGLGNKNHALFSSFKLDSGEYEWYVQAIDNCFSGSIFSKGQNFNISNKLTPITLDAIAISVNEIYLSWIHDSNEETGYVVERSAGNNQNFSAIDTLESNSKEYTDKGLLTDTQYFYRIKTIYNDLSTEYSNEENKLTSPFEEQTSIILPQVSSSSVDWGDYDNDGDLDILLTGSYVSEIFRNDGNNSFTKQTGISLSEITGASVKWGDYNNDENLDILFCGNYMSKLYKNNGDNTFTAQNGISLASVSDCSVDWGDYDNDGDLDILLTGYNSGAFNTSFISKIYKNNGDNTFTDQKEISLPGIRQSSVAWGDYDNDGDLDVLMTGVTNNYTTITKIFKNNGNNTFSDQTGIIIPGIKDGSLDWGDYDNDGDLDILLTGYTDSKTRISRIYRNNGNNTFTEQTGISLTGVSDGTVAWGDYDNDGFLDILLTGNPYVNCISKIYKNNRDNTFTEQATIKLIGVNNGSVAWGDYDSDGDLDILLTGTTGNTFITKIYKNLTANANTIPSVPTDLKETVNGNSVTFNWNRATDKETSQNGLSYNMIIQSILNGKIIKSPMSNHGNGKRKVMRLGNVGQMNAWSIKDMPAGIYSWSIQAIDQSFAGSPFARTKTFIVGTSTSLDKPSKPSGPVNICLNSLNSEYSTSTIPNATTYRWSISPYDAGIVSGNTTTAMVDWSDNYKGTAKISVIALNTTSNFGISASSDTLIVTISTPPSSAEVISGDQTVCQGASGNVYKTIPISGAESYNWTLPQGAIGTSTSDNINVNFDLTAISGDIKVKGQNSCGTGGESSFAVTVNPTPEKPVVSKSGFTLKSNADQGNQWYKQDELIPGANQQELTSTGDGQYYVIVTESGCSSEPSDVFTVTGIETIKLKGLVEVYPNPVSQNLSIISVDNGTTIDYEFVNMIGKVIQKGSISGKTVIETSSFTPGIYLLKIDNGKTKETMKIIKE